LTEAISTGPWPDQSVLLSLNLVAKENKRFKVKGGPFFVLSFEVFITIMGAVLTYLVVLLQIPNTKLA
jgi:hypothetical protein